MYAHPSGGALVARAAGKGTGDGDDAQAADEGAYPSEASYRFEWVTATPAAIAGKLNDR